MRPIQTALLLLTLCAVPAVCLAQRASYPLVSPDGKSIVFTRTPAQGDGVPVIARIDGSNERVLSTSDLDRLQWLGDSKRLVFQKTREREGATLEVISAEGGAPRPFGRLPGEVQAVSPDGTWAVSLLGEWPKMRLSRVYFDGTAEKLLVAAQGTGLGSVVISPDGRRVFFMSMGPTGRTLRVVNADGTSPRDIVKFDPADGTPEMPSWSPDGRVIAVQAGRYSRQNPSQNTAHIWLIDVDTGARRKLAAHDDRPYLDETPSYLADGRIAIQSNRTGRMEIWIIGVDGSATQLTRSARALPEDKRD